MSLVELYMKELVMQQKLQHEYLLQQQQLFNQQTFQPPPSGGQLGGTFQLFQPLQMMPPPASFPPLQFAAINNNTPGTAGPFAAAPYCAAKPMETTFDSFAGTTGFPTFSQMANQMFSNNAAPTFSNYNSNNNGTYSFTADSTQSPSCCGSSLASLDSFPSPASSDSPDSNSCSSLSAPTVIHHKQQQQKRHSLQYKFPIINKNNNAIVSNGIGAAKKQQQMPPTDFSELMGTAAAQKPLLINNGQQLNQRMPQFVNKNNAVGVVQKRVSVSQSSTDHRVCADRIGQKLFARCIIVNEQCTKIVQHGNNNDKFRQYFNFGCRQFKQYSDKSCVKQCAKLDVNGDGLCNCDELKLYTKDDLWLYIFI
uniref:EF-hand domain-containing protein n=1 Tax=Globodera pallida TaxID=36090 RepID=A0A183C5F9_GLOPA